MLFRFLCLIGLFFFTPSSLLLSQSRVDQSKNIGYYKNDNSVVNFYALETRGIARDKNQYHWVTNIGFSGLIGGIALTSNHNHYYYIDGSVGLSFLFQYYGIGRNLLGLSFNIANLFLSEKANEYSNKKFFNPLISFGLRIYACDPFFFVFGTSYYLNVKRTTGNTTLSPYLGFGFYTQLGGKMGIDFTLRWDYLDRNNILLKAANNNQSINFIVSVYGVV